MTVQVPRPEHRPVKAYDRADHYTVICGCCGSVWPCFTVWRADSEDRFWITEKGRRAIAHE